MNADQRYMESIRHLNAMTLTAIDIIETQIISAEADDLHDWHVIDFVDHYTVF